MTDAPPGPGRDRRSRSLEPRRDPRSRSLELEAPSAAEGASSEAPATVGASSGLGVAAALLSAVPVRLALAVGTDLSPDEAYYLCAAREQAARGGWLGPGPIADHPPLLIWMLRLSDRLTWIPVELRVRLWPMALSLALGFAVVALARARGARPEGQALAAWTAGWALLPMAGGFVATPDGPALLAFCLALLWWTREPRASDAASNSSAREDGSRLGSNAAALGGSLAVAAGALAKVVLLPLAVVLAAVAPGGRLARAAWLVPLALVAPLLLPSLRFQLDHAYGAHGGPAAAGNAAAPVAWTAVGAIGALGAAVGAQLLLWSPWLVARGVTALGAMPRADRAVVLAMTILCAASALVRAVPPEPNWWAPAALVVVVAASTAGDLPRRRRLAMLALVLAPTVIAAGHTLRPFLGLMPATDPTARLHGWSTGNEPLEAAGVGPYGPAAERCVYQGSCDEIRLYFERMKLSFEGTPQGSSGP